MTDTKTPVEDLLAVAIDELPADLYSVSECTSLIRQPPQPNPLIDYASEVLEVDGMVNAAPIIVRARVLAVGEPSVFTPDGVPAEFLAATGAFDATELQLGATPIQLEILDSVQGDVSTRCSSDVGPRTRQLSFVRDRTS